MKYFLLCLLLMSFHRMCSQNLKIEASTHLGNLQDIFIHKNGTDVQVTQFDPWESIQDISISPDSQYFFFRHKSQRGKSWYLSLYDIHSLKKLASIIPGFGGSFSWNENHQIIHFWGCGTNCSNLIVYDLNLDITHDLGSSGGFIFSPKKDIMVQLSMDGTSFLLWDLRKPQGNEQLAFEGEIYRQIMGKTPIQIGTSIEFVHDYIFYTNPPINALNLTKVKYEINQLEFRPLHSLAFTY